jgi:50S ribosomal protein L16 3-hydroxylase
MHFPDGLVPDTFLKLHWQKKPLFMLAGFGTLDPDLEPDELAWLATQADVESRLVFTERHAGRVTYKVRHGPFDDKELTELPDRDWTLLVQDVDKHLPDFRDFFRQCNFIPDWRIDDLMISFAAPGGSVGPHRDNYDVFLVQGIGCREWHIAVDTPVRTDNTNSELSLLQPFDGDRVFTAGSSDVLYLPPGVPHWGIARERCMTWSIGMRAPEISEFAAAADRLLPNRAIDIPGDNDSRIFYQDPDLDATESVPGLIAESSLQRAQQCFDSARQFSLDEFTEIFGSMVTDPKAWLEPEQHDHRAVQRILRQLGEQSHLPVHGMARIAFTTSGEAKSTPCRVFANGFSRQITRDVVPQVSRLCAQRGLDRQDISRWQGDLDLAEILKWLLGRGVFEPGAG